MITKFNKSRQYVYVFAKFDIEFSGTLLCENHYTLNKEKAGLGFVPRTAFDI